MKANDIIESFEINERFGLMFVKLKHFEFKSHLIPSKPTCRQPLACVIEGGGINLLFPPHQLFRLAGDDEFVDKPAAIEGETFGFELNLKSGQRPPPQTFLLVLLFAFCK